MAEPIAPINNTGTRRRGAKESTSPNGWSSELTKLYVDHFDRLVDTVARQFRDRQLSEDCVQDAFMTFHTRHCQPAPGSELAYLRRMAHNNALAVLRRKATGRELEARAIETAELECPEELATAATVLGQVLLHIGGLPDRQREVISLRHIAQLSVAETADELGISTGTVKVHAHRASQSLRAQLDDLVAA